MRPGYLLLRGLTTLADAGGVLRETAGSGVLRGAARIFQEKGFHGARTEEICAAAGISPGSLFRYFPDKRAIILAIIEIEFARYARDVTSLANKEGLYWLTTLRGEDLAALIRPSDYNLYADSWLELARDPERGPQLLAMDAELRQTLVRRLEEGKTEG